MVEVLMAVIEPEVVAEPEVAKPRKRQSRSRQNHSRQAARSKTPKKSATRKNGEIVAVAEEGLKRELIPAEVTTSESELVATPATS